MPATEAPHRVEDVIDGIEHDDQEVTLAIAPDNKRILIGARCHLKRLLWTYDGYLRSVGQEGAHAELAEILTNPDTWSNYEDEETPPASDGTCSWPNCTQGYALDQTDELRAHEAHCSLRPVAAIAVAQPPRKKPQRKKQLPRNDP